MSNDIQIVRAFFPSVAKCRGSWVVSRGRGSWVVGVGAGKCRGQKKVFQKKIEIKKNK